MHISMTGRVPFPRLPRLPTPSKITFHLWPVKKHDNVVLAPPYHVRHLVVYKVNFTLKNTKGHNCIDWMLKYLNTKNSLHVHIAVSIIKENCIGQLNMQVWFNSSLLQYWRGSALNAVAERKGKKDFKHWDELGGEVLEDIDWEAVLFCLFCLIRLVLASCHLLKVKLLCSHREWVLEYYPSGYLTL